MMKAGNFVNMSLVIQKELDIYNQKRMALVRAVWARPTLTIVYLVESLGRIQG